MVVYFSGTGNSRYCAQMIASALGDELLDSTGYIRHQIAAELITGRPWVFVSPVYAWQPPRVFCDFIRSGSFDGEGRAYFVFTCGSDTGAAGATAAALCAGKGLQYMGALEVSMPENYITMFSAPSPQQAAEIIAAAGPRLQRGIELIRRQQPFPEKRASLLDRLKSGPINSGFYKFAIKADPFRHTEGCTGCGRCAELCPLGNIALEGGRPSWGARCTQCMACICGCPAEAIEYGSRSLGKRRYFCEEYKG